MKIALLAAFVGLAVQATPPRDTPATRSGGSAVIRGRITAAATDRPLHRVRVTLNAPTPNPPMAVTDTRGEYELTNLPAGTYSLTASRSGYLTMQYGQRRPAEGGRSIDVKDGQVLDGIDMSLVRGGVLAGMVTDDQNDPFAGITVEAMEFRYLRGRRVLVQAASATTNDLGHYRLSGLPPGTYFLKASSTDTWESDEGTDTFAYAMTYYPGVTASDQAERVTLGAGQELSNLNFGVRAGRAATITGVMRTATGEPAALRTVTYDRAIRGVGSVPFAQGQGGSARTDANGAFTFPRLAPGEYVVYSGNDAIHMAVTVSDGESRQIVLASCQPTSLAGTIVSDDGAPLPFLASRLRVIPVATDAESVFRSFTMSNPVTVARDGTFRFERINGSHLLRLSGLPPEWMLASVTLNGKPTTDTPIVIRTGDSDVSGVQLVVSRRTGRIDGDVVGADGRPAPDSTVVVFSADAAHWAIASRFVHSVRPDNSGRFVVTGLAPGIYRVAAREFIADGEWEDPEFLASLAIDAPKIEVREGEPARVTLKLEGKR